MRETKRELMPQYSYYDRTGIAAHLADMAAQGWMLEKLGAWSWRYRRTEPKKLRFAVTFFPASQFDPGPSEGLETYRDYCAAAGWVLAADTAQVQIFYTEDENAVPIETDPAAEYANIRRCMKKSFLASCWSLLAVSLFQVLFTLWRIWTDPVDTLSSTASLSALLDWLPLDLVLIWELARYYRWQRRAKAAAESGAPLPDLRSVRWLGVLVLVWTYGVLLWLLASYWNSRGMFLLMAGMALYMCLMIFLSLAARPLKMPTKKARMSTKFFSLMRRSRHIRKSMKSRWRRLPPSVSSVCAVCSSAIFLSIFHTPRPVMTVATVWRSILRSIERLTFWR